MKRFLPLLALGVALAGCGSGDTSADPSAAKPAEPAPAEAVKAQQQDAQTSPDEANQRAAAAAKG